MTKDLSSMIFPLSVACESLTLIQKELQDEATLADKFGIALTAFKELLDIATDRKEPPVTNAWTLEEVKAKASDIASHGLSDKVKELIQAFGARKLSEVDPSRYDEFMQELDKCMPD